jgi:hypothetical protein
MSVSSPASATQQRIPAWKRIGLKLKYAKDTTTIPSQEPQYSVSDASQHNGSKRPPEHVAKGSPVAAKKQKILADPTHNTSKSENNGTHHIGSVIEHSNLAAASSDQASPVEHRTIRGNHKKFNAEEYVVRS